MDGLAEQLLTLLPLPGVLGESFARGFLHWEAVHVDLL